MQTSSWTDRTRSGHHAAGVEGPETGAMPRRQRLWERGRTGQGRSGVPPVGEKAVKEGESRVGTSKLCPEGRLRGS